MSSSNLDENDHLYDDPFEDPTLSNRRRETLSKKRSEEAAIYCKPEVETFIRCTEEAGMFALAWSGYKSLITCDSHRQCLDVGSVEITR